MKNIVSFFHHIHHIDGEHKVHHCGGKHRSFDKSINYTIRHCPCEKHSIDKEFAIGHSADNTIRVKIQFLEKCLYGGWHLESGVEVYVYKKQIPRRNLFYSFLLFIKKRRK